ncbi:unnamed protein product [Agarophyton chilense]
MNNPNDFLNFESSPDCLSEHPAQGLLGYLNSASAQDGGLVDVPDCEADYIAPPPLPVDNLGLLSSHHPMSSPSGQNAQDEFFDLVRANEDQTGAAPITSEEGAQNNDAEPIMPMFTRSISDVTMEMLHRTSFAGGEKHEVADPNSFPLVVPSTGQPSQASPTISAIQTMWQGNIMPTPLPQAVNRSEYGTNCTTATLSNGFVMPERRFFSLPLESGHANVRIGTEPVRVRLSQICGSETPQAIAEPPEEVQRVATSHLLPSGLPSGTLQAAKQDVHGRLVSGKRSREGAVVRRVLKRMAKRTSDVPPVVSRVCEEQAKQEVGDDRHQSRDAEKRGTKRKIEEADNEEELKKLRRVRNRESVEKCRAKQRMRLEKLEEEDKALRMECELMRQISEVFQEKWREVAEEYRRICGKDAGESPLVIPLNTELPDVTSLPAGEGS